MHNLLAHDTTDQKIRDFIENHVDVNQIAIGLFELILKHPDKNCLTFGMLPAEIMNSFENHLSKKIPDTIFHTRLKEFLDGKKIRSEITHKVVVQILKLAKEYKLCIV